MVLEVSKAGRWMREMSPAYILSLMREPGFESSSAIGRGMSEASGAWPRRRSGRCGGWRALAAQGLGDLRLPDPDKDRQSVWADGLRGLGRDGPPCERRTDVGAGYDGIREQALSDE